MSPILCYHHLLSPLVSLYKKAIHFEPLFLIYLPCYE
ncbi:pyridine nucleotide-disulfide oxidoreductase [Streptococcus pseudopneumoniae]|nr:pyridine nucleotide-disulfide oxidoreductase [Streptococcus pseudopneumoniae]NIB66416.1 pyridine nucleotide-disulfide oxidoreductase [Streptococcus pseudopneumoniae]NIB71637.1 pyridine nucleotide-disulfide oxidoreductase [Streptococcus pseudopneumoniae]NIB73636.1 pyridine nucleotide-disulfide oxidoreductase [Streptococcus pseudopneumoniae]NIB78430.1 pyridine nucleotide-disulfide oxidoreductase [Streptococcus pseudopneumoniae]